MYHQQRVDWSSRYHVPLPLQEETVELCQRDVAQVAVRPYLVSYDSSDEDEDDVKYVPGKIDYSTMSKGDLQRAIDGALDDGDYARVKEITDILNKKYPQK